MNMIARNWYVNQIWNGLNGRKHICMQQWPTMTALSTAPLTGHRLQKPKRTSKSFGNICKYEDKLDGVWRDAELHPFKSFWYARFSGKSSMIDCIEIGKFLENPRARINRKGPLRGRQPDGYATVGTGFFLQVSLPTTMPADHWSPQLIRSSHHPNQQCDGWELNGLVPELELSSDSFRPQI